MTLVERIKFMSPVKVIAFIFLSAVAFVTAAEEVKVGDISIMRAWANPLPPISENGAAYISLSNHAMKADRLLAASSPIADGVQFHTHVQNGQAMMMKRIESVAIDPHGTIEMVPSKMHLMLIDLKKPLVAGAQFPLTLTFEKAGTTTVTVMIESGQIPATTKPMDHSMQHDKHKQ
jgi:copper(I)-binding protein